MKRSVRALLLYGLVLSSLSATAGPAADAPTLRALFERAWERSAPGRAAEGRRTEAAASRAVADSLLAGPSALEIAERSDRYNADRGQRERELALALPLWLPGQRDARQALAQGDAEEAEAGLVAARLAVAGELRAAIWELFAAEAEAVIARERFVAAQQLEADVVRREAVGDLARTDLLLVRQEALAARIAAAEAEARRVAGAERLRVLSGADRVPADAEEAIDAASAGEGHPRLRLAIAAAARARATLQLTEASRRDAPELLLGVRQSREDFAAPAQNTLRVAIRIPFASEGRNAPRLTAASTALAQTEAERLRIEAEVAAELRQSAAGLAAAQLADELAADRAAAAGERGRLLERSFALGELPLPELLRAQASGLEARLDAARARAAHALAKARHNQARGVLP